MQHDSQEQLVSFTSQTTVTPDHEKKICILRIRNWLDEVHRAVDMSYFQITFCLKKH